MSDTGDVREAGAPVVPPPSIRLVAWASLAGQVVVLLGRGGRAVDGSLVLSVLLGALLVGWVSAGVVRARTVRLVLAWVVLLLAALAEVVGLLTAPDIAAVLSTGALLVTTGLSLAGLASFRRSAWYRWHRDRPEAAERPSIAGLVAIGVLVGVLGGVAAPAEDGLAVDVRVAPR